MIDDYAALIIQRLAGGRLVELMPLFH